MFVLFHDCDSQIHTVGPDARFAMKQDPDDSTGATHDVCLHDPCAKILLFSGSETECKRFLELLYFALRDSKGAQVSELSRAAVQYTKRQAEAAQ